MWAAYAQESGTVVTADEVVAAARMFAAFLSQPTDVHVVIESGKPSVDLAAEVAKTARRKGVQ